MNRPEAAARLEALLARVIARKDAPRALRTPAVEGTSPSPAVEKRPELLLHTPLGGDPGQGPEIDMSERTMDLDLPLIEASLAEAAREAAPAVVARVEPLVVEAPRAPVVEAPPVPVVEAPPVPVVEAHPEVVVAEPDEIPELEPDPATPMRPPAPVEELREPTPVPVAPVVEADAPRSETFEAQELPAESAVVRVVPMAPPAPRALRALLERSLALKVRTTPGR